MLYIHTSNQLEVLKNKYASLVTQPLKDVFNTETVIVQNAGMARWLSMEMANLKGISANTEYLFPAEFMWRLLRLVSPDIPDYSQCAPDVLRYYIFTELISNSEHYPELHHYLKKTGNIDLLYSWELSNQIAKLFDQYLFYRSDWITQWEKQNWNSDSHWQSRLWVRCVKNNNLLHWLTLQEQFNNKISDFDIEQLPERISFFSMSALSPGYIDLLGEISNKTDIHIYIINPCQDEYWGDIQSLKTQTKLTHNERSYTEVGNTLLATLGKQGRNFIHKLVDISNGATEGVTVPEFDDQTNDLDSTILSIIQKDIFLLKESELTRQVTDFDDSIQFHSCHTPMREVEVLYDQVLDELRKDESLSPNDIVVMMPDIEKYAPYIETIFSSEIPDNQKLPFSIADRDPQTIFRTIQAINKLFILPDTFFDVEAVFELLEYSEILQHFNLTENELNYCRDLARSTNIRWGISNKTRTKEGLPNTEEHTWTYVLDKILLGYAIAGSDSCDELFNASRNLKLLPYADIEGSNSQTYSNFKKFTACVFSINDWKTQIYSLREWISKTITIIQQLTPENSDQQILFNTFDDLLKKSDIADFTAEIPFNVYQKMLQQCLSSITANEKFLGYGITFCAMVPMRSVPFKIVALMGMNDGEFPRQDSRLSFDLMLEKPSRADRSRRDEDRYLFLESILAARSKLIISYIGQSIKDNTILAPSIVISELMDTVEVISGKPIKSKLIKHPLHAFSPRYFTQEDDRNLFSYAKQFTHLLKQGNTKTTFISEPLEELDTTFKSLSLNTLIQFYKNPARFFLKQRFEIQTFDEEITLKTREPFEIETFKERELRKLLLSQGINDRMKQQIARAKGLLPYGNIGDNIFNNQRHKMKSFVDSLPDLTTQKDLVLELNIGKYQLKAAIDNLCSQDQDCGRCVTQVNKPYAKEYIALWLTHLVLNIYFKDDPSKQITRFYSPEKSFQLLSVDEPLKKLKRLLDHYWKGLHFPLEFFPRSAFALYTNRNKTNFKHSTDCWNGNLYAGEKQSFENWLLHRDVQLDNSDESTDFLTLSHAVFGELFDVFEEIQ